MLKGSIIIATADFGAFPSLQKHSPYALHLLLRCEDSAGRGERTFGGWERWKLEKVPGRGSTSRYTLRIRQMEGKALRGKRGTRKQRHGRLGGPGSRGADAERRKGGREGRPATDTAVNGPKLRHGFSHNLYF